MSFKKVALRGIAASIFLAIAVVGTTFADTKTSSSGSPGKSSLTDSASSAGAKCQYHAGFGWDLHAIAVVPPNVFARNRTSGVDSQRVGWRFRVQVQHAGGEWALLYKSSIVKAMATDATKAVFGARARELTGVLDDDNYRVVVNILWYRTDGSVAGRVTRRVDFNHRQDDEDADVDFGAFHSTCVGHFGF